MFPIILRLNWIGYYEEYICRIKTTFSAYQYVVIMTFAVVMGAVIKRIDFIRMALMVVLAFTENEWLPYLPLALQVPKKWTLKFASSKFKKKMFGPRVNYLCFWLYMYILIFRHPCQFYERFEIGTTHVFFQGMF